MLGGWVFLMSEVPLYTQQRLQADESAHTPTLSLYRDTLLMRNNPLLEPYSMTMSWDIWWPYEGGLFLMREIPLAVVKGSYLTLHRSYRGTSLIRNGPPPP